MSKTSTAKFEHNEAWYHNLLNYAPYHIMLDYDLGKSIDIH